LDRNTLISEIKKKQSFLCVGLDTAIDRIPKFLLDHEDPIFEFNKAIIEATAPHCVAYKPNLAFYEALGVKGWQALEKTLDYIPDTHFTIADAKRGDIGNTSKMYAQAMFESMSFDSITVAPYMGVDSVSPFLDFKDKWVILLALTSNKGSRDFQFNIQENGHPLYQNVMEKSMTWGTPDNLMFVVGATHPEKFAEIRSIAPNNFLLVPGIGAQGGDLDGVCQYGLNEDIGLLVNSSRGIIYASDGEDFAEAAGKAAEHLALQMKASLAKWQLAKK